MQVETDVTWLHKQKESESRESSPWSSVLFAARDVEHSLSTKICAMRFLLLSPIVPAQGKLFVVINIFIHVFRSNFL